MLIIFINKIQEFLDQLLDISSENFIFVKTFDSELSYIEVSLTGQNSEPLEIGNKINIT